MKEARHLQLLHQCKDPVRADTGTPYSCSQHDLDGYARFHHSNRDMVYISPNTATNNLVRFLDIHNELTPKADEVLHRIARGLENPNWGPDIVFKAFRDLDIAFFGGVLTGNVLVRWKTRGISKDSYGLCQKVGHGQARISLNADVILRVSDDPFRQMWRTILHEMCHAYIFITTGQHDNMPGEPELKTWVGGHGVHFRRCIHSVDRRSDRYLGITAISSQEDYLEHF